MDALEDWTELVRGPGPIPLDEASLRIASCFLPHVDVAAQLRRLDELAAGVTGHTSAAVLHHLFGDEGFHGDTAHYDSPLNSFLPSVLDRRLGIPITLAVVAIEVGRRVGVELVGVGLPGHFLLREAANEGAYIDAFAGGRLLDREACIELFARFDPASTFHDRYLDATTTGDVLGRMLANLLGSFARRHRRPDFALALRMRAVLRDIPVPDRLASAQRLVDTGRVDYAADVLELVAEDAPADAADLRNRATELRARLN